jgi:hypothetical protein
MPDSDRHPEPADQVPDPYLFQPNINYTFSRKFNIGTVQKNIENYETCDSEENNKTM